MYNFIEDADCDTGVVKYETPEKGLLIVVNEIIIVKCKHGTQIPASSSGLGAMHWVRIGWHSWHVLPLTGIAPKLLTPWEKDGSVIIGEDTPLLFCHDKGVFRCCVSAGNNVS